MRNTHAWLAVLASAAACGDPASTDVAPDAAPDAPLAPIFRNPVPLPDAELAHEALTLMQAQCEGCHGLTRQRLRYWRALSDTALSKCLTDLAVTDDASARRMIDCTRDTPENPSTDWQVKKLGIYATATNLPWFQFAFARAFGEHDGMAQLASFDNTVAMPKDAPHLSQEQFDVLAEWFARGIPQLEEELGPDPAPTTCTPGISADVATHVATLATTGWRAVNRTNMMAMYGCGSAIDPKDCLGAEPLASSFAYGTGWDIPSRGTARVLHDVTYESAFWTRSSPDGRFVGHGVKNADSAIVDLQRGVTVTVDTDYDPAFFPDNSGFVYQGGPRNVCSISVLTSNPSHITMTEPACSRITTIGLYEHVGRGLDGGDFFAIDGQFESDDGGKEPTHEQPATSFTTNAFTDFTPMIFDGTKFVTKARVRVMNPFEGDTVLSPSAQLELTRVAGPGEEQLGYVLRKIVATPAGTTYTITTPEIARYCFAGGKPGFSYDERWIAFHRYVTDTDDAAQELGFASKADAGFAGYASAGAANLYLMDLRTGTPIRITHMAPGQYALFPHFRSDGWIYAQVRDANTEHEYTIATDAALLAE